MATNQTEYYQLSLWEPDDRILRTEFNENHQKIDAALHGLSTDVAGAEGDLAGVAGRVTGLEGGMTTVTGKVTALEGKAAGLTGDVTNLTGKVTGLTGKVTGLETAVAKCGNCQIVTGTYVGTGVKSAGMTISFSQRPLLVIVMGKHTMIVPGTVESGTSVHMGPGGNSYNNFSWAENTLRWSNLDSLDYQLNEQDVTYTYMAIYVK